MSPVISHSLNLLVMHCWSAPAYRRWPRSALFTPKGLRVFHVHVLDRPIERGDFFKAAAPILKMPPHPQCAGFLVAPPDRIQQMAVGFDQPRSALRDAVDDHFGGRKK